MKIETGIYKKSINGKDLYFVTITRRSRLNRSISIVRKKGLIPSLAEAIRVKKKLTEEAVRELGRREGQGKTWLEIMDAWKQYYTVEDLNRYSDATIMDYYSLLNKWTHHLKKKPINEIKRSEFLHAINLIKKERSIKHTAKLKDAIKAIYKWSIDYQIARGLNDDAICGLSVSRKVMVRTEILHEAQIVKLMAEASRQNHPWYEIWGMALFTGLRSGEMRALRWSDIDFEQKMLNVTKSICQKTNKTKETKTGESRSLPLNDQSIKLLAQLKPKTFDTGYVFPRISQWESGGQAQVLRVFCESIGVPSVCFHSLRACFATQLLMNGVGLNVVQVMGGWRDTATMKHYNRLAGVEIKGATSSLNFLPINQ